MRLTLLSLFLLVGCNRFTGPTIPKSDRDFVARGDTNPLVATEFPVDWNMHCDYPEADKNNVRNAFIYWDSLTPVDLFREVGCSDGASKGRIFVKRKNGTYSRKGKPDRKVWAAAFVPKFDDRWRGAILEFYDLYFNEGGRRRFLRESIVRHEVGHALGLLHLEHYPCLMYGFLGYDDPLFNSPKNLCDYEKEVFMRIYGGAIDIPEDTVR